MRTTWSAVPSGGGPWQGHLSQVQRTPALSSADPTEGAWASPHIPPRAGEASLLLFSGAETVGTQAPFDRCVMYVVRCAGAGLKATGHLHGMETTFQFPLTNDRFHFHSPPFPHHSHTGFSTAPQESRVRHPSFSLWCLCLAGPKAPKGSAPLRASCFLQTLPRTPFLAHGESHTGRQVPGRQSWLCP